MFSIYILTKDEELDIAACIESALACDDIIVVDSFSRDRTVEIAQRYPVRVVQHAFESHGKQRTWMLNHVPTQYEWAYILEADERMTPELFEECCRAVEHSPHVGYYAAERVMFMGRWIRHCTQYPRYQLRLLRKGCVWYDDYGHTEREVVDGTAGFLKATYPHYTEGKGFARWLDKHNRYSSDEAQETVRQLQAGRVDWHRLFFGRTEVERRHALKNLSLRLPCRPLVRFLYMYFLLGGLWDGRPGFTWCVLQAFYEYTIVLKVWELQNGIHGPEQRRPTAGGSDVALGLGGADHQHHHHHRAIAPPPLPGTSLPGPGTHDGSSPMTMAAQPERLGPRDRR